MRRPLIPSALTLALAACLIAATPAMGASKAFTDPTGDAPHGPATDITKVTIVHGSTVKVVVKMKKAAPFSAWGTAGNLVNIMIYVNPGGYYIASSLQTKLFTGKTEVPGCSVGRSRSAAKNTYTFKVPRRCLGNPAKIQASVNAGAFGSVSPAESDRAPATGFSRKVAFG